MDEPTSQASISELRFGPFLVYSPRGQSEISKRSKTVCLQIKQDTNDMIARAIARLASDFSRTGLSEVLGPDVTLVPAPRSTPLVEGALWPGHRIASELVKAGLGREILPIVKRTAPVSKSATAAPGERPSVDEHLATLELEPLLANPSRVAIVDDVITKGRTLLATATRLAERFPHADIRAFALVRTMGLQPDVEKILTPCVGVIRRNGWNDAVRQDDLVETPDKQV